MLTTRRAQRLACVAVVAACGGNATPPTLTPQTAAVVIEAPIVTVGDVLATDDAPPPVIVLIDANGHRSLAAADSWKAVGSGVFRAGPTRGSDEATTELLRRGSGADPKSLVDDLPAHERELASRARRTLDDDPPPPETEEEDESGGIGTAMALEEGKMGKRERNNTSLRGGRSIEHGHREPVRQSLIVGEITNAKLTAVPAVVIPHPNAPAKLVVRAVIELQAMIGVRNGRQVRPLRIQFQDDRENGLAEVTRWMEVRIDASGLTVEAVPSQSVTFAWHDFPRLKEVLVAIRDRRKFDARTVVDVLVSPDVDTQRLIDVLVALDAAGTTAIGLGFTPPANQLALRGHDPEPERTVDERMPAGTPRRYNVPAVSLGSPNAQGDLDKDIIRRYVKRNVDKIQYCFEKELVGNPKLAGTVQVKFFIAPDGTVRTSSAAGVNPALASCVADVIRGIEFPKPKGGGGVQVNYPFTFRPE